jgi:hypothetical protein
LNLQRSLSILLLTATLVSAIPLVTTEGFDNVGSLPGKGWLFHNESDPVGSTDWFQGNTGLFPAHSGNDDSYIAANFLNAGTGGDVQNWLITPVFQYVNGSRISFWTRTTLNPAIAPDRLRLRFSDNGGSTAITDFDTFLSVNESLTPTGYPATWTQFTYTFTGLPGLTRGRFAFEYSVPETSLNGDYIGIDSVVFTSDVPEPATVLMLTTGMVILLLTRKLPRFAIGAIAAFVTLPGSVPVGAEEAKRQTPKWQAIQVDVIQKELTAEDGATASAGRIFVREGAETTEANARVATATTVPKGKTGDSFSVKLPGKGRAAKLGPSYMSTLVVTRNSDSSIKVTHKPSNHVEHGAKRGAKEVSRDR